LKTQLDKIWLHQAVKLLVVLGWVQIFPPGLGWVSQLMGRVGSGHTKRTHGQLWVNLTELIDGQTEHEHCRARNGAIFTTSSLLGSAYLALCHRPWSRQRGCPTSSPVSTGTGDRSRKAGACLISANKWAIKVDDFQGQSRSPRQRRHSAAYSNGTLSDRIVKASVSYKNVSSPSVVILRSRAAKWALLASFRCLRGHTHTHTHTPV